MDFVIRLTPCCGSQPPIWCKQHNKPSCFQSCVRVPVLIGSFFTHKCSLVFSSSGLYVACLWADQPANDRLSVTHYILTLWKLKYSSHPPLVLPLIYYTVNYFKHFLPEDGDVFDGTPDGRPILLGGLSPLTLPGVLMAPCLSMVSGDLWGVWPDQGGGLGLPHHPIKSQCVVRELEKQTKCPLNRWKYKTTTLLVE